MTELIITAFIAAFILQFLDASAGMGYGTLSAILILFNFPPLEAISAVICTGAVLSLLAGFLHHGFKNIDLADKKNKKILLVLIGFGIFAITVGVFTAMNIPAFYLKLYIGILVSAIGIFILIKKSKKRTFSWKRLLFFGSLASFNKGLSGEGYGPVLAGGQILSGVDPKKAVGITALSEGIVSLVGFSFFILINGMASVNWILIVCLLAGGLISTPLAVYFVKSTKTEKLKYLIGLISLASGLLIIIRMFT